MQDRQHHPEQRRQGSLRAEDQRKHAGGDREIGRQKPDRQEQQVEPARLDVVIVVQAVLHLARQRPWQRRRMKRESVHAVFAQVKQQRTKQDQERLDREQAKQKGQRLDRHAHHERRDTAVAKEHEEHPAIP